MLNVKLTFDYEIFFGKNNVSFDKILFETTDKIMDILDEFSIKGVFYIDVLSYQWFEQNKKYDYCEKFKAQVIDMLKRGHNPQLHIHGHWLSTSYDSTKDCFICETSKYKIQNYPHDLIEKAINYGISFLNMCAAQAKVIYECNMFRAGGLILEPESNLLNILFSHGIKYDSSVAIGTFSNIKDAEYDYRVSPKRLNWYFKQNEKWNNVSSVENNFIYEIPVATIKNSIFRYLFVKGGPKIKFYNNRGSGFIRPLQPKKSILYKLKNFYNYHWISLDTRKATVIISDLKQVWKRYRLHKSDASVALIGHPKLFTDSHLSNLRSLIVESSKKSFFLLK